MDMSFAWHTREEKLLVVSYWWKHQNGKCCICDEQMLPYHRDNTNNPMRATIEHLIPKRENGPNNAGNVRLAHAICNNALGALWEMNQQRAKDGLEPMSREWALNAAKGTLKVRQGISAMTPRERARNNVDKAFEKVERKAKGVTWCAQNAISLPRGATLTPEYLDKIAVEAADSRTRMNAKAASDQVKRARKMTTLETAQWLASLGIRGA
jgi:hypothetical protein